jgi:hypothetical protein
MTFARSSRPGLACSFMVRRGLWLRLAGLLVGRVEDEALALPFLKGSESLDVNLGRGMLADTDVVARRRHGLRLFTERGTYGLGCAAKSA